MQCQNRIQYAGSWRPTRCQREAYEGELYCKICRAAKARGERRSEAAEAEREAHREVRARSRERAALADAVVEAARAWLRLHEGIGDGMVPEGGLVKAVRAYEARRLEQASE
mgnify:CR=1 FL=1